MLADPLPGRIGGGLGREAEVEFERLEDLVGPEPAGAVRGEAGPPGRRSGRANPALPADSHAITLPSVSVRVTIVLLNEVLMWACP